MVHLFGKRQGERISNDNADDILIVENNDSLIDIDHDDTTKDEIQVNSSDDSQQQGLSSSTQLLDPITYPYGMVGPYEWSTSMGTKNLSSIPFLTSSICTQALTELFKGTSNYDRNPFLLSVVVESSSHPAGIEALYAQPYVYAGGGLGNIDECPLMTCLAGAGGIEHRDSITFASVCMVPECSAYDLASDDFVPTIQRVLEAQKTSNRKYVTELNMDTTTGSGLTWMKRQQQLGKEYVHLLQKISDVNHFLKTGWTCGAFIVPWNPWPFGIPYVMLLSIFFICFIIGSLHSRSGARKSHSEFKAVTTSKDTIKVGCHTTSTFVTEASPLITNIDVLIQDHGQDTNEIDKMTIRPLADEERNSSLGYRTFWRAFDTGQHCRDLIRQPKYDTRFLDGLRVGSLLWIVLGHTMAIVSSSGGGYSNPSNFLPPNGITTTILGQLLFSSRLAVDTFLVISGFLVVHVVNVKFPLEADSTQSGYLFHVNRDSNSFHSYWLSVVSSAKRYVRYLPLLVLSRVIRIVPTYAACLGFFTQIAPQMGSGPFWHQWIGLLKPCHDYAWTNFLFINNFIPTNTAVTETCFYHSWYLAVDMQLYLLAPFLIFIYQSNKNLGMVVASICFGLSAVSAISLSHSRGWSINSFDGAAIGRYDIEGYAKPYIRGKSYFAGMFVAMLQLRSTKNILISPLQRITTLLLASLVMIFITFIPAFGAYDRRPCSYQEYPAKDYCGSTWSSSTTFLFASFSQTIWVVCVSILIYVLALQSQSLNARLNVDNSCKRGQSNENLTKHSVVLTILSWRCWTPLSRLAFGVYLIHPIVLFVWQLGDREKKVFRLLTFSMDFVSVCVVSYVAALLVFVSIESPTAIYWKYFVATLSKKMNSTQ